MVRNGDLRMKKIVCALLTLCLSLSCLTGCLAEKKFPGSDKIEAMRKTVADYDSCRYYITNLDTGVLEQVFAYYYDGEDRQVYLCEGMQGGEYYAEYSNGLELFREEDGVGANIGSTDPTYAKYTREEPHPYSTGQLFFYINGYIEAAEELTDENGNTIYMYYYNLEKLNKVLDEAVSEFSTAYAFDPDGNFLYFRQHNASADYTDDNGVPISFAYEITVHDVNSLTELENPVVIGGSAVK